MPEFRGVVLDDSGSAVSGADVDLYDADTTTPSRASTTTDGSGLWSISHSTRGRFDVGIVNGSDTVFLRARDRVQFSRLDLNENAADTEALVVTRSENVASVEVAIFEGDRSTPADDDLAYISLRLADSAGNQDEQARIGWQATTVASGATQDGDLVLSALTNGTLTEYLRIDGSSGSTQFTNGSVFIGDTSNADMTTGMTLNQGAADDEIQAFKSSDVAHGMTDLAETDTYGVMRKVVGADGGLNTIGYSDAHRAIQFTGRAATELTTDTTSSLAAVTLSGQLKSGATVTDMGTTGNVFAVANNGTTRFIIKGNGDIHGSDTDGATALDSYDDSALVRTLETHSNRSGVIRDEWDDFVKYNEQDLIDAGLYTTPRSEGGLLNISQLMRLHNGAIWQQAKRIMFLEQKLAALPEGN